MFGFLVAPAQLVQKLAHVIAMIPNPQLLLDQSGNSLRGPQFGAVAMGQGALRQEPDQSSLLGGGKFGRPARHGLGLEPLLSFGPEGIAPAQDAAGVATEAPGDFTQREISFEKSDDFPSPLFQESGRSVRSHRGGFFVVASRVLHYLCGSQ